MQDSSLVALQRVYVQVHDAANGLGPALITQLTEAFTLELRKAGLRVARDLEELTADDAQLHVTYVAGQRTLSTDLSLRLHLLQPARLERTGKVFHMVTWNYEDNVRNAVLRDSSPAMLPKATNVFLGRWMDANGR